MAVVLWEAKLEGGAVGAAPREYLLLKEDDSDLVDQSHEVRGGHDYVACEVHEAYSLYSVKFGVQFL